MQSLLHRHFSFSCLTLRKKNTNCKLHLFLDFALDHTICGKDLGLGQDILDLNFSVLIFIAFLEHSVRIAQVRKQDYKQLFKN